MVRNLGSLLGMSKQTEMLLMTFVTLWANIFDMTLFELGNNLDQVWNVELDDSHFTPEVQSLIKITLSSVVFVRTFSLHMYIAFLIAMLWPVCFGTHSTLMLPWLSVSAIKNIGAGIVTFFTGLYTCLMYGPLRPACLQFFSSQFVDLSPSFYMWIIGISLYRDLLKPPQVDENMLRRTEENEFNMALRRRKVKSMVDEDILRKQFESRRKFLGSSAIEVNEIVFPSFDEKVQRKISRSLDSLLDAMIIQAEIMETEDFEPLEEGLNIPQKTAKLLGISTSEISRIKQFKKTNLDSYLYCINTQKKLINIADPVLKHESPLKLLTESSLYSPSLKPIRSTKSDFQSQKDFLKLKSPSDFMQSIPESVLCFSNYLVHSEQCLGETILQSVTLNSGKINRNGHEEENNIRTIEIIKQKDELGDRWDLIDIKSISNDKISEIIAKSIETRKISFKNLAPNIRTLTDSNLNKVESIPKICDTESINTNKETLKLELLTETKSKEDIISEISKSETEILSQIETEELDNETPIDINELQDLILPINVVDLDDETQEEISESSNSKSKSDSSSEPETTKSESCSIKTQIDECEFPLPLPKEFKGKKQINQEVGCQASTISRKILNAPAKEMTAKFSKIPDTKNSSKTNHIKPTTIENISPSKSQVNGCHRRVSNGCVHSKSSFASGSRTSSYLGIHLHKLELEKAFDNRYGMDKFNIVQKLSMEESGKETTNFVYNSFLTNDKENLEYMEKQQI